VVAKKPRPMPAGLFGFELGRWISVNNLRTPRRAEWWWSSS
jgi:hypothetical protein